MIQIDEQVLSTTGAKSISAKAHVQTLWSCYGEIVRYYLQGGEYNSVIVKHIQLPKQTNHPRGWNTNTSHLRKLKSYEVETNWYQGLAKLTTHASKVPKLIDSVQMPEEVLLIMEDLNASGLDLRPQPTDVTLQDAKNCLSWLAHFHAKFMGTKPDNLWPVGTYWQLDTRQDEWERMRNQELKQAASAIHDRLNRAAYQTIVHGDAKLANFCFDRAGHVAAVDFQYVGQGCGMKDVAYFISSCFEENECEAHETELLEWYFSQLKMGWDNSFDFQEVKEEWTSLYAYAWADLYRFLDGWSPGHWKIHGYTEKLTRKVLNEVNR